MLENDFFEEYKRLDKLCKEYLGTTDGVTGYIKKMDDTAWHEQTSVETWDVVYKRLKHVRWIRNKLAHDVDALGANLCTKNDLEWVETFRKDIINGADPFAILRSISASERKFYTPPATPISREETKVKAIDANKNIISVGDAIEAETHAKLLNRLLGKNYKGYMSCVYKFDADNLIWMIRLNDKLSKEGWCNSLREKGERVTENYLGDDYERLPSHKETVFRQTRYIFDILEDDNGNRKYVFRGVFKFAVNEGSNDYRVWKKIANEWDITKFKNS